MQLVTCHLICLLQLTICFYGTSMVEAAACGSAVSHKTINESTPVGFTIESIDGTYTGTFSLAGVNQYSCYFAVSSGTLNLVKQLDLENMTSCIDGSKTALASVPSIITFLLECVGGGNGILALTLVDINEFAPVFNPPGFTLNVSEAASSGDIVIQLNGYVSEADKSNQKTFNFLLLSGAQGKFAMVDSATSGIVRVSGALDYDAGQRLYQMNVSASELGTNAASVPVPLTGFATLNVVVTDFDDQNPVFLSSDYAFAFMENDTGLLGQLFRTTPPLEARDSDFGINQTVNYAIESGNLINNVTFLDVDNATGQLRIMSVLDRETLTLNPMYLRIRAYQIDKPTLRTAVAFVTVTVTDKNDNPPVMSAHSYSASLPENSPDGTYVTQVAAADADFGSNATVVYNLTDISGAFTIEANTGIVRVRNSTLLDRETFSAFNLTVWAQEALTLERWSSGQSRLLIQLSDVNDNPPAFASSAYAFNVSADAAVGTQVGTVSATDPDLGVNAAVSYSLTFATSGGLAYFHLNAANGSLTVASSLTSAQSTTIFLLAQAEDQATPSSLRMRSAAALTVTVAPVLTTTTSTTSTTSTTTTTTTAPTTTTTTTTTTSPPSTSTLTTTAMSTASTATPAATIWNVTTSVASTRQFNSTHFILEMQTVVFVSNGRWVSFNQSILTAVATADMTTSASTTATAPISTETTSASTNSSTTTAATLSPTSSASVTSTTTSLPVTSTSATSQQPVGGSATSGAVSLVLIALCVLMALLLVAALATIYCLWKRRPCIGASAVVSPAGASATASQQQGATARPGHGGKGKMAAAHSNSSRINYSEFYFDDKDVSGAPIMVLNNPAGEFFSRPPSYTQLKPDSTDDGFVEVST